MNTGGQDFDFSHLRHFYLVAFFRGFSRASRASGLSQPALSTGVKKLEKSLGVKLFKRSSTEFGLTPAGSALLDFCQEMESRWSLLRLGIASSKRRGVRRLRVGTALSVGFSPAVSLVKSLVKSGETLSAEISTANSYQVVRDLQEGKLDVAFLPDDVQGQDLRHEPLSKDRVILIASPNAMPQIKGDHWRKTFTELVLLTYPPDTPMRSFVDRVLIRERLHFRSEISASVEAMRVMVQAGVGVAFILRSLVVDDLKSGTLKEVRLPIALPKRGVSLAFRRHDRTLNDILAILRR